MKISIITINFNNIKGLRKTIDSVLSQTWRDFEWIFIDGGSTDGSKELIEKTAAECSNVSFWCSEPDKGVYNAQNKGIMHARGEYMNFMNSGDTFYDENTLKNVWKDSHKEDVIYGDWLWCSEKGEVLAECPHEATVAWFYTANICHQAMFIRSSLLKDEGYDETYKAYADWARWMKMACEGRTFKYVPYIICRFELGGLSGVNSEQNTKETHMVKSIPDARLLQVLKVYEQTKQELDRYKYYRFNPTALVLMEKRPLYRRIFRLCTGLVTFLDKILSCKE